jgi:hypothetical protein
LFLDPFLTDAFTELERNVLTARNTPARSPAPLP